MAEHGANSSSSIGTATGPRPRVSGFEPSGVQTLVTGTDVSDPLAVRELFEQVDATFGRVDFLGNIAGDGHLAKPEDLTIADLQRVLQNLVIGRFAMCQEAAAECSLRARYRS